MIHPQREGKRRTSPKAKAPTVKAGSHECVPLRRISSAFAAEQERRRSIATLLDWTRRATTARSPKRFCLGPAERKHRRAGSSEQQILLLARGEAGASTRDRDAIGSRFEQKATRTRSWLRLSPVVAHARDRALADRAS